jgi:hypothetical protein
LPGSPTDAASKERKPRPLGGIGMVKIVGLQCVVQDYRYGIARGDRAGAARAAAPDPPAGGHGGRQIRLRVPVLDPSCTRTSMSGSAE